MEKVIKMSEFDKIWIEGDVDQDREKKTEKIQEIIKALSGVGCVENVTKVQYQMPRQEPE